MTNLKMMFLTGVLGTCCSAVSIVFYFIQPGFLSSPSSMYSILSMSSKILLVVFYTLFLFLRKSTSTALTRIIILLDILAIIDMVVFNSSYLDEIYSKSFVFQLVGSALFCGYFYLKSSDIFLKVVSCGEFILLIMAATVTLLSIMLPYANLWFCQVLCNGIASIGFLVFLIALYKHYIRAALVA